MARSTLQSFSIREEARKNSYKACMGTLSYGHSLLIYRYLVNEFFIKTLIIITISTNIYIIYVCDPLDLYISLVNNSIDQITSYWSILLIIYINI